MVRRERHEKLALARFLALLAQAAFNVPAALIEPIFKDYADVVVHAAYAKPPKPVKSKKQVETEALLNKLNRLTVDDSDLPKPPTKRGRAGRR